MPSFRPISPVYALGVLPVLRPALPPYFLRVLAALPYAASTVEVAARSALSVATVRRTLAASRGALGLPAGRHKHYAPPALAEAFIAALAQGQGRMVGADPRG
ncbi:MAG TPA: hypothetical protein VFS21_07130 [Roseiflexaceae bacterium]|nr:hypothetical protein [Roseiflexaceae bacterium]